MSFWKNVDEYLKYKDIPRKVLAAGIGMKTQTIDRAIQRDSEPKFVEGLKVCKFLKVSTDEFLDKPIVLPKEIPCEPEEDFKNEISLYRKYHDLILNCETISENHKTAVRQLAQSLAEASPVYSSEK